MSYKSRWPTVYDFEQLQSQIKEIVKCNYSQGFYTSLPKQNELYQGDIIKLDKKFVSLGADGNFEAEMYSSFWIVLGNSCDFARDTKDLPYTNIIPLQKLNSDIPEKIKNGLKNFQNYKHMYIPDFLGDDSEYFLDFTKIMTISKEYLLQDIKTIKIKELSYTAWVLFHSCIIRYFARDDGRND